jgi:CRP-like cAMP-binding protein
MQELDFIKRQLEALHPIPDEQWQKFCALFKKRELKKGDHFIHVGDQVEKFGFIAKGLVRFYVNTSEGNEYNQSFKKENEIIAAYFPMLTKKPSPMGVEALEDTILYEIMYNDFEHFYEEDTTWLILGRKFIELNLIIKAERELELLTLDGKSRYQKYLQEKSDLLDRVPQYHLALHFGMNPSAFNRMIKKIKD